LNQSFVDLGMTPLANSLLTQETVNSPEVYYPLHAFVCEQCFLVQLEEFKSPTDIFSDYVYFSSYSETWLEHASRYADAIRERLKLDEGSFVVEVASNDGYLLKNFVDRGIRCLGIEPAENVARVARKAGVPTEAMFFGAETAKQVAAVHGKANLIIANNVLAHVPDLNDFVGGFKVLLENGGTITFEFPHLLNLIDKTQFDTIYHEHFSYLSLTAVEPLLARHGLRLFDVEELPTHGGSLRICVCHREDHTKRETVGLTVVREKEEAAGLDTLDTYRGFDARVRDVKLSLLEFVTRARREGKRIVCYGAAAKGNTLLNYCGIGKDFIDLAVDRSPHKQSRYLPGTHIRVCEPAAVLQSRPDYLLILPWNLKDEIMEQMATIRDWGGQFVIPIPRLEVSA
jgi:SAM-dependent methyltransferase